ncbi:DUF3429 domain-containing protein [Rhizobium sp. FY34]|uniref:DUF3429 domain-containing protein n=1 Tax=Rhizobium sp. FY34 TaxID=2562309 RepID=UPI0010BFF362|nr:DUF3429 domain-containing protein [Rhizobium sp. FY34]
MQDARRLTLALTYAGALPFFLLLPPRLTILEGFDALHAFLAYGAVIASFMAGSLWGLVQARDTPPLSAIAISNLLALTAWGTLLLEPDRLALILQVLVFLAALFSDQRLAKASLEKPWYWQLRTRITAIVCIAYLAKILLI